MKQPPPLKSFHHNYKGRRWKSVRAPSILAMTDRLSATRKHSFRARTRLVRASNKLLCNKTCAQSLIIVVTSLISDSGVFTCVFTAAVCSFQKPHFSFVWFSWNPQSVPRYKMDKFDFNSKIKKINKHFWFYFWYNFCRGVNDSHFQVSIHQITHRYHMHSQNKQSNTEDAASGVILRDAIFLKDMWCTAGPRG